MKNKSHRRSHQLISSDGQRKYINQEERQRFIHVIKGIEDSQKLFCYMLLLTGVRISEALNLKASHIDFSNLTVNIESLKKRTKGKWRQIPLPEWYLEALKSYIINIKLASEDRVWSQSRRTATRQISKIMKDADIVGIQSCSRGLRHSYGITLVQVGVPVSLVKRWMGHESLETTIIYLNVIGKEEREFAEKFWNLSKGAS